jgi:hypothetical protein
VKCSIQQFRQTAGFTRRGPLAAGWKGILEDWQGKGVRHALSKTLGEILGWQGSRSETPDRGPWHRGLEDETSATQSVPAEVSTEQARQGKEGQAPILGSDAIQDLIINFKNGIKR